MTHLGSPEHFNKLFASYQFLPENARSAYERLVNACRAMQRDADRVSYPDFNEAGAWSKCFDIFERMKQRDERAFAAHAASGQEFAAIEAIWNEYVRNLEKARQYVASDRWTPSVRTYFGLTTDDLGEPIIPDEKYGHARRPDWIERAERIADALHRWRYMAPGQRAAIPQIMATLALRKQVEALKGASNGNV